MTTIDPEQERRRLIDFYAGMMDGELEKIGTQSDELTDLAREALQAELARRGLKTELVEHAVHEDHAVDEDELDLHRLVTIRKFRDLPEALLAKGSLESAGIETFLLDDNVVRLDWFWSNLMGGIKLQVNQEDAEAANGILDQPIPEAFDAVGAGEYQQPRCPNCHSLDVSFQELNQPVAYLSAFAGLPVPVRRRGWRCHSCDVEWEEVEDDDKNEEQTREGQAD